MPRLEFRLPLPGVGQRAIWEFHRDPAALLLLTPPDKKIAVLEAPAEMGSGARVVFRVTHFGVALQWVSLIEAWDPPRGFVDIQETGPFARWRHEHVFEEELLVDRIDYEVPLARLGGRLADHVIVRPDLERMFAYRHLVTTAALLPKR